MHQFLKFILGMKLYMFQTVPLSIIRSFSLYTQQWCMSYSFADSLRTGAFAPARKLSANLYDIYEGNSISKLQIQVATYVFELSAGNCHR